MSTVKTIAMPLLSRDPQDLRSGHLYAYAGGGADGLPMR
jgi:hypothetical protein